MTCSAHANESYWDKYTGLQATKHRLIREYLNGWFPKLGHWAGRVIYIDTHAGRGRHATDHKGSPLIALETLVNHKEAKNLLQKCEFTFIFIERDQSNYERLQKEIGAFGPLPENIKVIPECNNYSEVLGTAIDFLRKSHKRMAPAFVFVDPYGFSIDGKLLRELISFPRVELFINVMWRELDMAIKREREASSNMSETLTMIFCGDEWKTKIASQDSDARADETMQLLRTQYGAKWATFVRMLGKNNTTRYCLLHLTNHDAGRDLMKQCLWKICPNGHFAVRAKDDPGQQMLFPQEYNEEELERWVKAKLKEEPLRWEQLIELVRHEIWIPSQLNKVIRRLRKKKIIVATSYSGRFTKNSNPLLALVTPNSEGTE